MEASTGLWIYASQHTYADPFQNTVLTEGDAIQNVVFGHFVIIFPVLRSGAFMSGVKSLLN